MKKIRLLVISLAVMLLFSTQAYAVDQVFKFWADEDSYLSKGWGDTNYGDGAFLRTRDWVNTSDSENFARALLKFNQSDLETQLDGKEIISVSLHLYEYWRGSGTSSADSLNLFRVTNDWTESGVTWNNFVDGTEHANQAVAGRMFDSDDTTPGWRSWQSDGLKFLVENWLSGGTVNYGVMLENDLDGDTNLMNVKFRSSEYLSGDSIYVPYLKITATPEPLSILLFGIGGGFLGLFGVRKRRKS